MEGRWEFTVHTYMGDMRSFYDFKVDGTTLTGTATDAANGATGAVEDGKYENGQFCFKMTIKTAVGEMTNELSGTVDGDTIKGKSKNPMGEFDVDAVRA